MDMVTLPAAESEIENIIRDIKCILENRSHSSIVQFKKMSDFLPTAKKKLLPQKTKIRCKKYVSRILFLHVAL